MAGYLLIYLLTVLVELVFQLTIPFHVQKVAFPLSEVTAELLSEVCHSVEVEPHLQPLNGEIFQYKMANTQDGAQLDISMNGFWGGHYEKCYTDIRVFNPLAVTHPTKVKVRIIL